MHLRLPEFKNSVSGACLSLCLMAATMICSCGNDSITEGISSTPEANNDTITQEKPYHFSGVPNVILDTDLGNCTDDALAIQLLFKYRAERRLNLLAVMSSSTVTQAKRLLDAFLHYYKADDVPLGLTEEEGPVYIMIPYYQLVDSTYADGTPWLPSTGIPLYDRLPAWKEYRRQLSKAADHSVSIVSIGSMTNLGKLMDSTADEYSSLSGMDLISQKVKELNIMGGCFTKLKLRFDKGYLETEYNIGGNIPLAKKVLEEWPTYYSLFPLEEGMKFPSDHDEVISDYAWNTQSPMYLIYSHYNEWERGDVGQYWWDPITLLHCVDSETYFRCTALGELSISDKGVTSFQEEEGGKAHIIEVNAAQNRALSQTLRDAAKWKP